MRTILHNFLYSGHTFTKSEEGIKYKYLFLNNIIGFASFVAFIMGFVRIDQNYFLMGCIDIVFALVFIYLLLRLRSSKDNIESISKALIFLAYLLFLAIYLFANTQSTRLALFFLLIASAFFLRGKRTGFYWLLTVIFTIIVVHVVKPLETYYSNLDIFTFIAYLSALYMIMNFYDAIQNAQTEVLCYCNEHLESLVEQRTKELEITNTELKKEKESLYEISITDQLTGLRNRYQIRELFDFEMAQSRRYDTDLSIIMMDIDYFKAINDIYGHSVGDQFLKEFAEILKRTLRETEMVVRWGGEEFLIIVPKADAVKVNETAQRLKKQIEQKIFSSVGHRTASFGIATFVENDSFDSMLIRADNALYAAKEHGRNRIEIR